MVLALKIPENCGWLKISEVIHGLKSLEWATSSFVVLQLQIIILIYALV